jgi:hypothetical protein
MLQHQIQANLNAAAAAALPQRAAFPAYSQGQGQGQGQEAQVKTLRHLNSFPLIAQPGQGSKIIHPPQDISLVSLHLLFLCQGSIFQRFFES